MSEIEKPGMEIENTMQPDSQEKFGTRQKLFGDSAERIQRSELQGILGEIEAKARDRFVTYAPTQQLLDKESFGDIDIIAQTSDNWDRDFFEEIFGNDLVEYHRNGGIYSLLLKTEGGKHIQTDFIRAEDPEDFERKSIYYSKGHTSSVIGMFGKKLGFKYGTEGFFKRYQDSKGQWHDTFVTGDLREGMEILGLSPEDWESIEEIGDIAPFIAKSPLFSTDFFEQSSMVRRDREAIARNPAQAHIVDQIRSLNKSPEIEDADSIFREGFPEVYAEFVDASQRIEQEINTRKAVDGNLIMDTFGIEPGPMVGKIIAYIQEHHPDIEKITPEIEAEIKDLIED